jgi:hypothetical protein
MTRRFWWNPKKASGRFLAWKSWDHLCTSKNNGGLGFRKAKKFNKVFIAKLTLMIVSKRNSPCMVALRSKYKVTDSWLKEEPRKFSSHTWRAVERMKNLITKGACFLIGNGGSIDIWKEPWVPWLPGYILRPKSLTTNYPLLKVADLINPINNCWFEEKLLKLFDEESINAIKRIVIPAAPSLDKLIWILDAKGKFSVKSAFNINHAPAQIVDESLWSQLWKLKIHDRYKLLVWRIATGILPTRLTVAQKLGAGDSSCPLCQDCEESIDHLFFKCSVSRAIWFGSSRAIHSSLLTITSSQDILKFICNPAFCLMTNTRPRCCLNKPPYNLPILLTVFGL